MAAPDGGPLSPCGPLTSCTARWRAVLTQSIRMTSPARQKLPHLQCKNLPLCLTPVPFDRSTSSWLERHDIKKERMRQEGVKEGWGWRGRRKNKSFVPPPTTLGEKKTRTPARGAGRTTFLVGRQKPSSYLLRPEQGHEFYGSLLLQTIRALVVRSWFCYQTYTDSAGDIWFSSSDRQVRAAGSRGMRRSVTCTTEDMR